MKQIRKSFLKRNISKQKIRGRKAPYRLIDPVLTQVAEALVSDTADSDSEEGTGSSKVLAI